MRIEVVDFAAFLQSFRRSASEPLTFALWIPGWPVLPKPSSELDGRTGVPDIFLRALGCQDSPPETSCDSKCWVLLHLSKVSAKVPQNRPLEPF